MNENWKIIYYQTTQGFSPVKDFIQSLDIKIRGKISNSFDLLEEFGIKLRLPHIKKLAGTRSMGT